MTDNVLEDHPLLLELQSLRASVAQFQEEAHASAVKLQRHSLDVARSHERAVQLERENDVLRSELALLRANPHPNAQSSPLESQRQVQELTLSLRRLSHKLSLTEEALLAKTTELLTAQAQTAKAIASTENAYELGARVRGREEEGLSKQRDLEFKARKLEEQLKMSDGVIQEYAALVREMEGARSSSEDRNSRDLPSSLRDMASLDHLFSEFQTESKDLEARLQKVTAELEVCRAELDAEKKVHQTLLGELGHSRTELQKLQLEDSTAAKMVSRYMQFSQTSTNNLLTTLNTLQTRHSATISTLTSQNHLLSTKVRSLESQNERLRSALDELGGEIMKETYGRRREVALRIKMGGREERVVEGLRRWVRRGDELLGRVRRTEAEDEATAAHLDALLDMAQHARILLEGIDEGVLDEQSALSLSSGKARALVIQRGLQGLLDELKEQTERRVTLEKQIADMKDAGMLDAHANGNGHGYVDEDLPPPQVPEKTPHLGATPLPSDPGFSSEPSRISDTHPLPAEPTIEPSSVSSTTHESPSIELQASLEASHSPIDHTNPQEKQEVESDLHASQPLPPPADFPAHELSPAKSSNKDLPEDVVPDDSSSAPFGDDQASSQDLDSLPPPPVILVETDRAAPLSIVAQGADSIKYTQSPNSHVDSELPATSSSSPPAQESDTPQPNSISFPSTSASASPSTPPIPLVSPVILPAASIPEPETMEETRPPTPNPLLAELTRVSKRYDDLQRAFRDCHLALDGLKTSLGSNSPYGYQSSTSLAAPTASSNSSSIPPDVLRAALSRLDDYTEDARVELEIRIGDESLLAKGYEALLSVPGALATPSARKVRRTLDGHVAASANRDDDDEPTQNDVEQQIEAFVSGTDPAVRKAHEAFTRKLEDVQHDIAALKKAIHDPQSLEGYEQAQEPLLSASLPQVTSSTASLVSPSENQGQNSGGWSSWIRGSSSRSSSPAPTPHSSTFGAIMTDPRLRHSPSTGSFQSQMQNQNQRARKTSFFGLGGTASEAPKDPLAPLGLKVPMPNFASVGGGLASAGLGGFGVGGGYGLISPTSPMAPATRSRTVSSTMYMLGLSTAGQAGNPSRMLRSASGASSNFSPGLSRQSSTISLSSSSHAHSRHASEEPRGVDRDVGEVTEDEEEEDTDVE